MTHVNIDGVLYNIVSHSETPGAARADGLHCVYGQCKGPPLGPLPTCSVGCSFTMNTVSAVEFMSQRFPDINKPPAPPTIYETVAADILALANAPRTPQSDVMLSHADSLQQAYVAALRLAVTMRRQLELGK